MLSCVTASVKSKAVAEVLIPSDYMMLPAIRDAASMQLEQTSPKPPLHPPNQTHHLSPESTSYEESSPSSSSSKDNMNHKFDDIAADIVICTLVLAFVALQYRDIVLTCR